MRGKDNPDRRPAPAIPGTADLENLVEEHFGKDKPGAAHLDLGLNGGGHVVLVDGDGREVKRHALPGTPAPAKEVNP